MSEYLIATRAAELDESVGTVKVELTDGSTLVELTATDGHGNSVTVLLDWRGSVDVMSALGACASQL